MDALAICGSECEFFREETDFLGIFWAGRRRERVRGSPLLSSSSSFGAVVVSPPPSSCITAVALRIVKLVVVRRD